MPDKVYDAVVIGGGAAGLFCAFQAGKRGRRVAVLEHNAEVGRKIIISGGGRCNFTNIHTTAENFISQNPHFYKSALAGYTPQEFVDLVKKHRVPFYEKKLGQLFCRESSRAIVEMLLVECKAARVDVVTSCSVTGVEHGDDFVVNTARGTFRSSKLVIACGGLSFPKVGATSFGYDVARQFGLKIVETRPSLVALVAENEKFAGLAGISVDSNVSSGGKTFRENILFTHRGMSGPAILQISNYWAPEQAVEIDLSPGHNAAHILLKGREGRKSVAKLLSELIPAKLSQQIAKSSPKYLAEMSDAEIDSLGAAINARQLKFSRTEGYDRAEVTLGGVSTDELSSKTMEVEEVPGLFFIGEVVDVTGWLGGYNFQWAWASGFAAAKAI